MTAQKTVLYRIPRLYAAASLKLEQGFELPEQLQGIPRLYAAASLKRAKNDTTFELKRSIPRLYAAASLKHVGSLSRVVDVLAVFRGFMPRPH